MSVFARYFALLAGGVAVGIVATTLWRPSSTVHTLSGSAYVIENRVTGEMVFCARSRCEPTREIERTPSGLDVTGLNPVED